MRALDTYACTTAKPPGHEFDHLREVLNAANDAFERYEQVANYLATDPAPFVKDCLALHWPANVGLGDHAETERKLLKRLRSELPRLLREVADEAHREMECALTDLERALVERRQP